MKRRMLEAKGVVGEGEKAGEGEEEAELASEQGGASVGSPHH